jgi:hypothetical protein
MGILQILKEDYQRFPENQTSASMQKISFSKIPLSKFRGLGKYKAMIGFINTFFIAVKMDLHDIRQSGDTINMEWTLSWNTPLPWKPRIAVPGWSELKVNSDGLINSHIDYWKCSRLDVLKQHIPGYPVKGIKMNNF